MSVSLQIEVPESLFSALRQDQEGFRKELCLTAAVKWYEMGLISQGRAAELAGLSREEFLLSLFRFKISPIQYTIEEIKEELSRE